MATKTPPNTTVQIILAIAVGIFVIYSAGLINEKLKERTFIETGAAVFKDSHPLMPDTTAPSVSITYPAQDSVLTGKINVTAIAIDNAGVTKVEFYLDDVLKSTDLTAPYGFAWDTENVSNGNHTLVALAYDLAANLGISDGVIVLVSKWGSPSEDSGSIAGTVTSSQGAVISGVKVTTTVTGLRQSTVTDSAGVYNFIELPPGIYILKFQAQGFVAQSAIVFVATGATRVKNVVMQKR